MRGTSTSLEGFPNANNRGLATFMSTAFTSQGVPPVLQGIPLRSFAALSDNGQRVCVRHDGTTVGRVPLWHADLCIVVTIRRMSTIPHTFNV